MMKAAVLTQETGPSAGSQAHPALWTSFISTLLPERPKTIHPCKACIPFHSPLFPPWLKTPLYSRPNFTLLSKPQTSPCAILHTQWPTSLSHLLLRPHTSSHLQPHTPLCPMYPALFRHLSPAPHPPPPPWYQHPGEADKDLPRVAAAGYGAGAGQWHSAERDPRVIYLEGSVLVFDDIFKLIAFYCVSRDILPFTLRLPQAIAQATKYEDMEMISNLGSGFWGSSLNRCPDEGRGCSRKADPRTPSPAHAHSHASHCSCDFQLSVGNDRLWYVNPIFIEEYCSSLQPQATPISRTQSLTTPGQVGPRYKRPPPLPPRPQSSEELVAGTKQAKERTGGSSLPITPPVLKCTVRTKQEVESNGLDGPERQSPPQHGTSEAAVPSAHSTAARDLERKGPQQGCLAVPCPSAQLAVQGSEEKEPAKPPQGGTGKACPTAQSQPVCSSDGPSPAAQPLVGSTGKVSPSRQSQSQPQRRIPPVPPRGRLSKKQTEEPAIEEESAVPKEDGKEDTVAVATLVCIDDPPTVELQPPAGEEEMLQEHSAATSKTPAEMDVSASPAAKPKKPPPVPPPRKKRPSQFGHGQLSQDEPETTTEAESAPPQTSHSPAHRSFSVTAGDSKGADVSLYSPEGQAALLYEPDSYSTSSAEDEAETPGPSPSSAGPAAAVKRNPSTVILDRAKQRLSMVNLTNVFTSFMNAEQKLKKRVVELSRDGESYFGSLVRDYRAFTLETMRKHASSTEMLQEIRLMMTQLKCYLVQSAELQTLVEPNVYSEEKLEAIIESALCKGVLKPLREAVYSGLRDIHTRDESLKRLEENQQAVLGTTTTDLGVTTSVPEAPVMEKIQLKLAVLHKEYSPEKKIAILLKTCKIIYESMSYMMELMDPALQLGEGSYYLTTTYGALEHIKNFGKLEAPRQLSLEIQDSIHRWERRRTLNKACVSRNGVQDFINVSFLEAGSNTKTLGARRDTTAQDLCAQCSEKFEVLEPELYVLCVLVDGLYRPLGPTELPLSVKSSLHHSEPRREYFFVYRPGSWAKEVDPPPQPPANPPPDSLI
ncbi:hypothetical protein JZ751_010447 [Albula glossodonta]|uniref:Ras-associating domain-containing protein n=1 Tax=Albula glossodonta TaxID=121402 RepID=A0A8T2NZ90_9TELE|nr:hypothetical protein JZ751_010447 [Albula glossodonta]